MSRKSTMPPKKSVPGTSFHYNSAFQRNIGILSEDEQQRIRCCRVAIAGMGGMGGLYAQGFARLGIGRFHIADGDTFEVANFNRQVGGTTETAGQNKAEAVAGQIRQINPDTRIQTWNQDLDESNIDDFLDGADIVINAIEMFAPAAHRLLYQRSRARGLPCIFAAPLGFTAAVLAFGPDQADMNADTYFDWTDDQTPFEQIVHLAMGAAPKARHLRDIDLASVNLERHTGPSNISACLLGGGMVIIDAIKHLLGGRGSIDYAPCFRQIDGLSGSGVRGKLRRGNKSLPQKIKKWIIMRTYTRKQKRA